jgi:hypothetical protein
MGSQKQANALVQVVNKIRRSQMKGDMPPELEASYRLKILAMSLPEVREQFEMVNAHTKFDRVKSPATMPQLNRIKELELALYGKRLTSWEDGLTFERASDRISKLAAERAARIAGVRSLEVFANSEGVTQ